MVRRKSLRTVHILIVAAGSNITAGRHGADDIGDGECRRRLPVAIEGRDETIVAIFGMCRLDIALDPGERIDIAAFKRSGLSISSPAGKGSIKHEMRIARYAFRHFQGDDEAVVLLDLRRIERLAIKRIIAALEL